jgi:hypothetical protein
MSTETRSTVAGSKPANGTTARKPRTKKPVTPRSVALKVADLLDSLPDTEAREKAMHILKALSGT